MKQYLKNHHIMKPKSTIVDIQKPDGYNFEMPEGEIFIWPLGEEEVVTLT